MANPITFHSKSADLVYVAEQDDIREPKMLTVKHHRSLALFLGDVKPEFMEFGRKLGFTCILYDEKSDPSYVIQAKAVIAQHMQYHFVRYVELLNLAVSYGIPTVWIHPILPPGRWMWSFRYCLVGTDIRPADLWGKICQEIM